MRCLKFEVGQRVIVVNAGGVRNSNTGHKCGTIISANTGQLPPIGVEFDEYVHGHDCNHKGRYGYCWYMYEENLMLLSSKPNSAIKALI
nr:MAG TPA: SH3-like domain protein [Caudoviricetes sp.]